MSQAPDQTHRDPGSEAGRQSSNTHEATPLLIDRKGAARLLGVSERLLWSLTASDAIPVHRLGRRVLYARDELRLWIALGSPTEPGSAARVRREWRRGVA